MSAYQHHDLIETLYRALQRRDGAAMAACYAASARFRDPVFELAGARIGAMWKMLCARGAGLRVEFSAIVADAAEGVPTWRPGTRFPRPAGACTTSSKRVSVSATA